LVSRAASGSTRSSRRAAARPTGSRAWPSPVANIRARRPICGCATRSTQIPKGWRISTRSRDYICGV